MHLCFFIILIWFCSVWFGLVWIGLIWVNLVWFGFGLVWFGLVRSDSGLVWFWFGLIWSGLVWFELISFSFYFIFDNNVIALQVLLNGGSSQGNILSPVSSSPYSTSTLEESWPPLSRDNPWSHFLNYLRICMQPVSPGTWCSTPPWTCSIRPSLRPGFYPSSLYSRTGRE